MTYLYSPLLPSLTGRQLTVDYALKTPSLLRNRIAKLADDQILLPKVCRQFGAKIEGGALLYNSLSASEFFTSHIEARMPGAEYKTVEGVDPDPQSRSSPTGAGGLRCRSRSCSATT